MARKSKAHQNSINWNDLPPNCKQKVVEYLDFIERVFFGSCSKAELQLVTSTPIFIKELRLEQITELQYRILLPGCLEATICDPHRNKSLRNKRVFHDYVLFNRRRLVRKTDSGNFPQVLESVVNKFLENPICTIETLRLDDAFFVNRSVRLPLTTAKIEHLRIEKSQTSPTNWLNKEIADGYRTFSSTETIEEFVGKIKVTGLKTIICEHQLGTNINMNYEKYDDYIWDDSGDPLPPEPVFFDKPIIQNLKVLILPTIQNVRPRHLVTLKARKLEIWSPYLNMNDFMDFLQRWESEDVPVGSIVKMGMLKPNLEEINRFEVLEDSETSKLLKMLSESTESKQFRIFLEDPQKICCEVISAQDS